MQVAFINANVLGHASYLLPFVQTLQDRPELGIQPHLINASPLPPRLEQLVYQRVPKIRRWGLDFHHARYAGLVSWHVRGKLNDLLARQAIDAVVVNTHSVALGLTGIALKLPLFVCLDSTFAQALRDDGWFGHNPQQRPFLPLTIAPIRRRERTLLRRAHRLLAFSELVRRSLVQDYRLPPEKISLLPTSVALPPVKANTPPKNRPQILFIGGQFYRKGGPLLLECYRRYFADRCDLHLVTQADIRPEPGVFVHHGVVAQSRAWLERWEQADVFVFPSLMETFGNVLVEALSFQVPVISTEVGAAREILADGQAGLLLPSLDKETLAAAIHEVFNNPAAARARAARGFCHVEAHFNLATNAERLAAWLRSAGVTRPDGIH